MSIFSFFGKPKKKTLKDLIQGDAKITIRELLPLDEIQCRPDIIDAAVKILQDRKHGEDGYNILGELAVEGDVDAQFIMGDVCESMLERHEQAAIWYQRAADQGMAKAQRNYANMLMVGKGVPCDREKAFFYYTKAAEQGVAEAQFVLGEFYSNGVDVPKDLQKAVYWYEQSKQSGYDHAESRLKQIRENPPNGDDDDLSDLDRSILQLPAEVLQSAEDGLDYYTGRNGVQRDYLKAFPLLLNAAQRGHVSAQFGVASMFFHGQGIGKDITQAFSWYLKAAEGGMAEAQNEMANFYFNGVGCKKDMAMAASWLGKAADNGIVDAMFNYGAMLVQGVGLAKDQQKGLVYVKNAARNGHAQAQSELRQMGVPF